MPAGSFVLLMVMRDSVLSLNRTGMANRSGKRRPSRRHTADGEDPLDEREGAARSPQERFAAVTILDARQMRFEDEAPSVRA
jgi:hypothetical protein